jgi:hypothetical protein
MIFGLVKVLIGGWEVGIGAIVDQIPLGRRGYRFGGKKLPAFLFSCTIPSHKKAGKILSGRVFQK